MMMNGLVTPGLRGARGAGNSCGGGNDLCPAVAPPASFVATVQHDLLHFTKWDGDVF